MNDSFIWDNKTPVIIYGAAALGTLIYNNIKNNANIIAFMDKRADEITESKGLPVYKLYDNKLEAWKKEACLIILAVKNIFEHEEIVNDMIKDGFVNIIHSYSDISAYKKTNESSLSILRELFNKLVIPGFMLDLPYILPKTLATFNIEWKDRAVVSRANGNTFAHIPTAHAATNLYDDKTHIWGDVPVGAMFTHIEFFRSLAGDVYSDPDYYVREFVSYSARKIKEFDVTQEWANNVVVNRTMVFEQMNLSWEIDRGFFVRNAPEAAWNSNGYFNLTNGKHRSTFLASKDCKFITLSLSDKDYNEYINPTALTDLIEYLNRNKITKLFTPIMHPYFYQYPCVVSDALYTLTAKLTLFFGKYLYERYGRIDFTKLRVRNLSVRWKELIRYFAKMKCLAEDLTEEKEFDILINKLYRINIINKDNETAPPDLIICDDDTIPSIVISRFSLVITRNNTKNPLMSLFISGKRYFVALSKGESSCRQF